MNLTRSTQTHKPAKTIKVKRPFYLELVAENKSLHEELREARHYGTLLVDAVRVLESLEDAPQDRIDHYKTDAGMLWPDTPPAHS